MACSGMLLLQFLNPFLRCGYIVTEALYYQQGILATYPPPFIAGGGRCQLLGLNSGLELDLQGRKRYWTE